MTTTTTETTEISLPAEPTPTEPAQDSTDWKAKHDELLAQARKHEDRAKANAAAVKELDALKQSSMTDQQKAVEVAKAEARTEALREVGGKLAEASIRVAAAGRNVDVDALLEGVDPAKFLDVNGDPDTKAITAWVDRVAPPVDDSAKPAPRRDLGAGVRGQQNEALNGDPLLRDLKSKLGI